MPSILVIDDMPIVRAGIKVALDSSPSFEIVSEAGSGQEAVSKLLAFQPDLAILDYELGDMSGLDVMRSVQGTASGLKTKFVFITGTPSILVVDEIIKSPASGLISKGSNVALDKVLTQVLSNDVYIDPALLHDLLKFNHMLMDLSQREREVALLMVQSYSNQCIAEKLKITTRSVSSNRHKIREKIGNNALAQLKNLCRPAYLHR